MLLKPPPMGVVTGPFERDLVALDGFVERGGDVFAEDFEGLGAGGEALPLEFDAGGFEDADDGLRDFGADAVAGDEGYFVGSSSLCIARSFSASWCGRSYRLRDPSTRDD